MKKNFYKLVFDEVLNLSQDGFIVVDEEGTVTDISEVYAQFLGRPKSKIIGHSILDTIPNSKMPDIVKHKFKEELALHKFIPGYIKDDNNSFVLVSRSYVTDETGKAVAGVAQVHFRDQSITNAKRMLKEYNELEFLREQYQNFYANEMSFGDIVGISDIIKEKKMEGIKASKTNFSVLITGETGTGKEVFAKAIHYSSSRSHRPMVSVNCAAIPEELLESELFGYVDGAFTGAKKGGKKGKFLQADGGTLFLDEIGDMPLLMQAKLLRALQERVIDPVGSTQPIPVDIRIISATRRNLEEMIKEGTFREDLYYRLNVININLPPLRERREDIPSLIHYFLDKLNKEYNRNVTMSPNATNLLFRQQWYGNLRELDNAIRGAYAICDGLSIDVSDLPVKFQKENNSADLAASAEADPDHKPMYPFDPQNQSLRQYLKSIEKDEIDAAYKKFHSVRKAADYLGMSMTTYVRKRQEYSQKKSRQ